MGTSFKKNKNQLYNIQLYKKKYIFIFNSIIERLFNMIKVVFSSYKTKK